MNNFIFGNRFLFGVIAAQLATQTHVSDQCGALNSKKVIALISAWLLVMGEAAYEQVLEIKQGYSWPSPTLFVVDFGKCVGETRDSR